jgi:DNA-binding transcriptional MerR regulator
MFREVVIMISKKDLLKKMNISYGQLYRWKREELIPDHWFMKLSVSSGQETFFEEELIIPRISKILELKDKYSLEELKDILNGTSNLNLYKVDSLSNFNIFNKKILKENLKDREEELNLNEVTFLYLLSFIKDELNGDINYSLKTFPFELIKENNILTLIKNKNNYVLVISKENINASEEIVKTYLFHELKEKIVNIINGGL